MNKLDEIVKSLEDKYGFSLSNLEKHSCKQVALEFAKHILEEAAENAETIQDEEFFCLSNINKQSITDTLNKYL